MTFGKQKLCPHPDDSRNEELRKQRGVGATANTATPTVPGTCTSEADRRRRGWGTHGGLALIRLIQLPDLVQNHVFDENRQGLQDERHEQMDVDVVPGAVQLPAAAEQHSSFPLSLKLLFTQALHKLL